MFWFVASSVGPFMWLFPGQRNTRSPDHCIWRLQRQCRDRPWVFLTYCSSSAEKCITESFIDLFFFPVDWESWQELEGYNNCVLLQAAAFEELQGCSGGGCSRLLHLFLRAVQTGIYTGQIPSVWFNRWVQAHAGFHLSKYRGATIGSGNAALKAPFMAKISPER